MRDDLGPDDFSTERWGRSSARFTSQVPERYVVFVDGVGPDASPNIRVTAVGDPYPPAFLGSVPKLCDGGRAGHTGWFRTLVAASVLSASLNLDSFPWDTRRYRHGALVVSQF